MVGCKPRRVMFKHILLNLTSALLTLAVLEFARIILAEATLSFLGLGLQFPEVSLGVMANGGRDARSSRSPAWRSSRGSPSRSSSWR